MNWHRRDRWQKASIVAILAVVVAILIEGGMKGLAWTFVIGPIWCFTWMVVCSTPLLLDSPKVEREDIEILEADTT